MTLDQDTLHSSCNKSLILFSFPPSSFAVFVSSGPLVASTEADGEDLPGFTTSVKVLHYVLREITVCYTGPIS